MKPSNSDKVMAGSERSRSVVQMFGISAQHSPLRDAFLRWQCRVRQLAMRENSGRPDDAVMPTLTLAGQDTSIGRIVTVFSKAPQYTKTAELKHMVKRTGDPAHRREKAIEYFSEQYFQKAVEFSDVLTATFAADSKGATQILRARHCTLHFNAYAQQFSLHCRAWRLDKTNPLFQATWYHNQLFNPNMPSDLLMLAFEPDWSSSCAEPAVS